MLICHCNVITDRDISRVIRSLLSHDPWQIVVPAKVYHELGKRGRCCGCFPNVIDLITEVTAEYHRELVAIAADASSASATLLPAQKPDRRKLGGSRREGRTAGYRAAQRGAVS